jgi:transcriptional regulator with XRE-family HTH domain
VVDRTGSLLFRFRRRATGARLLDISTEAHLTPAFLSYYERGLRRATPETQDRLERALVRFERKQSREVNVERFDADQVSRPAGEMPLSVAAGDGRHSSSRSARQVARPFNPTDIEYLEIVRAYFRSALL